MKKIIKQLIELGFEKVESNIDTIFYTKPSKKQIKKYGICTPTKSQQKILEYIEWHTNPIIILVENSDTLILFEHFFILESPEMPITPLELRDLFDYKIEKELTSEYPNLSLLFGPHWHYILPVRNFEENIRKGNLFLSSPFVGNTINIRSKNITELINKYEEIKLSIQQKCPLPIVYGVPENMIVGEKDNFFDVNNKTWHYASVEIQKDIAISLIDLVNSENKIQLTQHKYNLDIIETVQMDLKETWVKFYSGNSKYRSRRKLKKMSIIIE